MGPALVPRRVVPSKSGDLTAGKPDAAESEPLAQSKNQPHLGKNQKRPLNEQPKFPFWARQPLDWCVTLATQTNSTRFPGNASPNPHSWQSQFPIDASVFYPAKMPRHEISNAPFTTTSHPFAPAPGRSHGWLAKSKTKTAVPQGFRLPHCVPFAVNILARRPQ